MTKDKVIFSIGIFISLIVIGTSGFLYYKKQLIINSEKLIIVTKPTQIPEPTKTPEVNYKNTEIQVLNGSGKAGLAKTYADKLTILGYTKITTGNYTEIITGNLLFAPTDFGKEINLENYTYEKSDLIKIIISK